MMEVASGVSCRRLRLFDFAQLILRSVPACRNNLGSAVQGFSRVSGCYPHFLCEAHVASTCATFVGGCACNNAPFDVVWYPAFLELPNLV